ncbi:alpha-L-glutamate ligase-like protein [Cobetia amphilecti]|uniref:alpha-L-glutamate ligase-like protein n=1 Tax=Cobetia amphilecti TaxID=1055104 RepID=UPI001C082DAA|nr:alpha-L-glutamate ligase-like protein [Cobetia amphilecti]MBU3008208.1 alpha-L-glutamate ligase-like protein [Cobetia amphilecti]
MLSSWLNRWSRNWTTPGVLRARGVVGMNRRNIGYISKYNDRRLYPLVDDKLQTKLLCQNYGLASPEMIGKVASQFEVERVVDMVRDHAGFVIKPAKGSGGKGILVIEHHDGEEYVKPSGARITRADMERHVSNILSGLYSLGGSPDVALVEGLISFDQAFAEFTYEGVPDIRVIVFKGYPVMAMMRLSTAASDGKANLHQGAVGVGLDIGSGWAVRGVQYDRPQFAHPDTGHDIFSLKVPQWDTLLELAAGCYEMTGLGYLGTDMVLDRRHGPMLLELNARPGLAIQMANGEGLRKRLELIERQPDGVPVAERVAFARKHFSRSKEDVANVGMAPIAD